MLFHHALALPGLPQWIGMRPLSFVPLGAYAGAVAIPFGNDCHGKRGNSPDININGGFHPKLIFGFQMVDFL